MPRTTLASQIASPAPIAQPKAAGSQCVSSLPYGMALYHISLPIVGWTVFQKRQQLPMVKNL